MELEVRTEIGLVIINLVNRTEIELVIMNVWVITGIGFSF